MKGFTLIEVLISVVIMTIMIGGLFMVLNIADLNWSLGGGLLGLQQQARQAMDGMVREIRQSNNSHISIPASTNIIFSIPTDITSVPVTYSELISYYVSSGQLFREHPMGSDPPDRVAVANDINSVTFCWCHGATCDTCDNVNGGSNLVRIQVVAGRTVRQRPVSFSLTEKVRLRNE